MPDAQSANTSVFDLIMQKPFVLQGPEALVATVISASYTFINLMADGLAKVGFESTLQGSLSSRLSRDGTSWIDGNYFHSATANDMTVSCTATLPRQMKGYRKDRQAGWKQDCLRSPDNMYFLCRWILSVPDEWIQFWSWHLSLHEIGGIHSIRTNLDLRIYQNSEPNELCSSSV